MKLLPFMILCTALLSHYSTRVQMFLLKWPVVAKEFLKEDDPDCISPLLVFFYSQSMDQKTWQKK